MSSSPASSLPDLTGQKIGRFQICERLGSGGMGEVYRAEDTVLKRAVAVKRLSHRAGDANSQQRFLREAERASALVNPHIAAVYDVIEHGGEFLIVMELVAGVPLRARLNRPMPLDEFSRLALQMADAVCAAHEHGIIHCDIKPENIMLTPADEVKVLDFGVAKQLWKESSPEAPTAESLSSTFGGTPAYMAPEVLLGQPPDVRSDIFSLGLAFFEMLAGQHAFCGPGSGPLPARILEQEAPKLREFRKDAPASLEYIVGRMLGRDPQQRYSSSRELLADLQSAQRAPSSTAWSAHLEKKARSSWPAILAIAAVIVCVIGALFWKLRPRPQAALPAGIRNVAVIPFRVINGTEEEQAESDGIAEILTAKLTGLTADHNFQIAPSSEVHGRKVTSAEQAMEELGANLVLEGSVQRSLDARRVVFSLVDAPGHRILRAETVTASANDIFGLEDQVVSAALRMLEVELKGPEKERVVQHGTQDQLAHESYLRGLGLLENYDRIQNVQRAGQDFEQAIKADPAYALAYAALGISYWRSYEHTSEPGLVKQATGACRRAQEMDPQLSAAHSCMGMVLLGTGSFEAAQTAYATAVKQDPTSEAAVRGLAEAYEKLQQPRLAEETYKQAIALRPNYWGGHESLAQFYLRKGRLKEAEQEYQEAARLAPSAMYPYEGVGNAKVFEGEYRDAILFFERAIAIHPSSSTYSNLGVCYFYLRDFKQAAANYERASQIEGAEPEVFGNIGEAYFLAGDMEKARPALLKALDLAQAHIQVNPKSVDDLQAAAQYHSMLGEREAALDSMNRALKISSAPDVLLKAAVVRVHLGEPQQAIPWLQRALKAGLQPALIRDDPTFDGMRNDPAFVGLNLGPK